MADDLNSPGDDPEGRNAAFHLAMGLSEGAYTAAVAASVAHALAAPADAALLPWVPHGARNIGGRVRALVQDPQRPLLWYAGTAMGGVFRSTDGGDTWSPLGQAQDSFAVGALALDPNAPHMLYIGTGEPVTVHSIVNPPAPAPAVVLGNDSASAGIGFLSCDTRNNPAVMVQEVASWSGTIAAAQAAAVLAIPPVAPPLPAAVPMPPGAADRYSRIVVDPQSPGRCWLASTTGLWRREPGPPVTFVRELVPGAAPPVAVNPSAAPQGAVVTDVVLSVLPGAPVTYRLFAGVATLGVYRGIYTPGAGGGVVWEAQPLAGGLPKPGTAAGLTHDRICLAVCRSAPDHVYAVFENGDASTDAGDPRAVLDVFHSSDGGSTWQGGVARGNADSAARTVGDGIEVGRGGQPWAHLVLAVHPDNPAIVACGGINLALSRDFGRTWRRIIYWPNFGAGDRSQHGDQHALVFDATDPRRLWVGNDGGIAMAPDVVQANPLTAGNWRKRSHGILAAQFNDIAVNPSHPTMVGGGLQDNATYISYGGETWHVVADADGGQMAFTVNDPRTCIAPNQEWVQSSSVARGTDTTASLNALVQRRFVSPDLPAPHDVHAVALRAFFNGANRLKSLFIPIIAQHPGTAGHWLVGQAGDTQVTSTNGQVVPPALSAFSSVGAGIAFVLPTVATSALAYGRSTGNAATEDWWLGTSWTNLPPPPPGGGFQNGQLALGRNVPPPLVWSIVTPPGLKIGSTFTRIAVHPRSDDCVAVCTASQDPTVASPANPFPFRGQVFLTLDRGQNWADITGLVAVGAPPPGALQALPPSPISSLVWDPQPAPGAPQVLYAGTLAGVWVIRNLPPLRVPAAVGAPGTLEPPFRPQWFSFNGHPANGPMPLALVKDLELSTLPANGAAAAGAPEAQLRHRLLAATYGRGMYVCDLSNYPAAIGPGGPRTRLYIRQTLVDAGLSYPRPTPAVLNAAPAAGAPDQYGGDPRVPLLPSPPYPILFTDVDAFDIRVDNPPLQFFDDVMDGVEFDEDLRSKPVAAGGLNVVYVQVHTSGWAAVPPVQVHLFWAPSGALGAPDLHAGFWANFSANPMPGPAAAPVAPAAEWRRAGAMATLDHLRPNQPEVARFEWVAPASLAGGSVALLAVCSTAVDAVLPAALSEVTATLVRNERRAALRIAPVGAFVPDLFIRDALDDDGRLGAVAAGGRSPDIIVVAAAPADPATTFADLADERDADRVQPGGAANVVYVRVHNRSLVDVAADVELFWARPHAATAPATPSGPFDASTWQLIAPVDAVNITVPASGTRLARFDFNAAPAAVPGVPDALAFIALVRSHDGADPTPQRTGVDTADEFWRLFAALANANNAALRALRLV